MMAAPTRMSSARTCRSLSPLKALVDPLSYIRQASLANMLQMVALSSVRRLLVAQAAVSLALLVLPKRSNLHTRAGAEDMQCMKIAAVSNIAQP